MTRPVLLIYETEAEYLNYYREEYCRKGVVAFDGIRVYFREHRFLHAFYESSNRDGKKDTFSRMRVQRMNWIRATLQNTGSVLFQGWDKRNRRYDPGRRVCIVYEDFIVVLEMRLKKNRELKAEFVTCYQADDNIRRIRMSPKWSKEECIEALNKKGR